MRQRFYREAQTAGKLTHPNIVTVYDVGEDLGMSYIVMEFFEGQTLAQLMKQTALQRCANKHVIYNAGMGLDYAHENGVFHRDVKPDNVMISKAGIVKVMDFGIARIVESNLTKTGQRDRHPCLHVPGAGQRPEDRCPERHLLARRDPLRAADRQEALHRRDGLLPDVRDHQGGSHPCPRPSTPRSTRPGTRSFGKALAKNREERYATAKEFAQAVRGVPVR